jgi:hypothetical protein
MSVSQVKASIASTDKPTGASIYLDRPIAKKFSEKAIIKENRGLVNKK